MNSQIALYAFFLSSGVLCYGILTKNIPLDKSLPILIAFLLGTSIVFALLNIGSQIKNSMKMKKSKPKTQAHNEGKQTP